MAKKKQEPKHEDGPQALAPESIPESLIALAVSEVLEQVKVESEYEKHPKFSKFKGEK